MIRYGKELPFGDSQNIQWIESDVETALIREQYQLIVAGSAVHWFDLPVVLTRFTKVISPDSYFVVLDGDGAVNSPWQTEEYELMLDLGERRTGVRPQFNAVNTADDIILDHSQFKMVGKKAIRGTFSQSNGNYVSAQQSRTSLSRDTLGPKLAEEHERGLRSILAQYAVNGELEFETCTRIEWGRPLSPPDLCKN